MNATFPLLLLVGCGLIDPPGEPLIEAHRGAAGYWPENSRTAMLNSLEAGYDALEFDVVLTADGVPVFMHDPTIPHLCTDLDGVEQDGSELVMDYTLEELQTQFLCGGVRDETMPDAELVAETVMTFEELLVALEDHPDVLVHIDSKWEDGKTPDLDVFVPAVMETWFAADLPNDYYVSANKVAFIEAVEAYDPDIPTAIVWPEFTPETNDTLVAVSSDLAQGTGVFDIISRARDINADGLTLRYEVMDWHAVSAARQDGLFVSVWTINDEALLDNYYRWPVDMLITDYPDLAP